ncbi:MAG: hypothetical protein RL754_1036 [Bacteroidota bacterium]|jgi:glutathione synthase/RimK-type ligase-like ATP-grasp enzyme/ribosomal protein S18 acetylase RimI-like enzyme
MKTNCRKATIDDLDFLLRLEDTAFPEFQRNTKANLKRGLKSAFQEVFIIEDTLGEVPLGSAVIFKYKHMLRIYSIAVFPQHQNAGIGNELLRFILEYAQKHNYKGLSLEVSEANTRLIEWYAVRGFAHLKLLKDYYAPGEHALKMGLVLTKKAAVNENKNIIVIDQPYVWERPDIKANVISVKEYINNPVYQNNASFRVFNLCSSYKYQSYGYYVSLLASARGQRVVPSSSTIKDVQISNVIKSLSFDLNDVIERSLAKEIDSSLSLPVFFGQTPQSKYKALAAKLFQIYEIPLFNVVFVKSEKWVIKNIRVLTYKSLVGEESQVFYEAARAYFKKKRYGFPKLNNFKYDIAVLLDPFEANPPSDKGALDKFRGVANKKGVYVEFITKNDANRINEFDALFIRETTNVNHHTYEISRLAFAEGLVVLDDPWSILRCSNKIFQHELFRKHKIRTPKTIALTKNMFDNSVLDEIHYPMVLKQPDSAFSLGVIKVKDKHEAKEQLSMLFKKTDMVICQEFLFSDFDWRIGILDNKPLFACKYYMSQDHWQIYNWNSDQVDKSGKHETISIQDVPEKVVRTALKAASLIGDGLYGVDLKFVDDKVYVIEVNDNPNIDKGVEDEILGDHLYEALVDSFVDRIEVMKNIRYIGLASD